MPRRAAHPSHRRRLGERLIKRHRSFYVYMIGGFAASVVNTVAFLLFHSWLKMAVVYANTIAFVISNLFSFFVNKEFVFTQNLDDRHGVLYQLGMFFLYRLLSLIPDNLIMVVGLSWLHWNTLFVKIIDQIMVGLINYLTTRSIFQRNEHSMIKKAKQRMQERKLAEKKSKS